MRNAAKKSYSQAENPAFEQGFSAAKADDLYMIHELHRELDLLQ